MRHEDQPSADESTRERADRRKPVRRAKDAGFSIFPTRHADQPQEHPASKRRDEDNENDLEFWHQVSDAYRICSSIIELSSDLRRSRAGKDWVRIAKTRVDWLKEDEEQLAWRIADNKQHEHTEIRRIDGRTVRTVIPGLVDTTELIQKCRKQEDRLRRLRSRAVDAVMAKPSRVDREYEDGVTYDKKIQETLRDVYEKCAKARKAWMREFDEAERKQETEMLAEQGERRRRD